MMYQIRHRHFPERVIYECEAASIRECVERAVQQGVDLSYADLKAANLRHATLSLGVFRHADLRAADCAESTMIDADFEGAYLAGINMSLTNSARSILRYVNARGADMRGMTLDQCDGSCGNFRGADMRGCSIAGMTTVGADFSGALGVDS